MKKLLGLFLVISFISCASIIKGTNELVSIDSNVKGADVVVNGKTIGQTPYNGKIKRASESTITIKKEGYQSKTIVADTTIEPIFWGNILVGGVLGSSTDFGTGAMYKYSPATFIVDLTPLEANIQGK